MGHDHIVGLDTLHVYRFAIDDQPPPSPTPSPNLRAHRQRRALRAPFRFSMLDQDMLEQVFVVPSLP